MMNINSIYLGALAIGALTLGFPAHAAAVKYITDEFEVTMRSGTSVSNSIVRMLKSGEAVTILEEDLTSKYSLVEVEDGRTGYVLNRYLVDTISSKDQLEILQISADQQKTLTASLQADVERLKAGLEREQSDNEALKNTLLASEKELSRVKDAASNALDIAAKNDTLESVVAQLGNDMSALSEENAALKDTTKLDWLVRGAGVTLVAFIIGILVTRIRWKKQDSWGSY